MLASGEIVVASREENAELFWALRGAGANFGIVTSFTSQGYAWGDCWAGLLAYTPDKLNALIQSGNEFSESHVMPLLFSKRWYKLILVPSDSHGQQLHALNHPGQLPATKPGFRNSRGCFPQRSTRTR